MVQFTHVQMCFSTSFLPNRLTRKTQAVFADTNILYKNQHVKEADKREEEIQSKVHFHYKGLLVLFTVNGATLVKVKSSRPDLYIDIY